MDKELQQAGFNVNTLTEEQKSIIMQPSYAPENYYQDGEINKQEAFKLWMNKLKSSGLSPYYIDKAIKMQFG